MEYQGEVKFLKVDTDEEFQLASQLEVGYQVPVWLRDADLQLNLISYAMLLAAFSTALEIFYLNFNSER